MNKYSLLILIGAALWGTMGVFSRTLAGMGLEPLQVSCVRVIWAAVFVSVFMLIKDRSAFRVKLKHLPLLALTGGVSVYAMSFFYISAISAASMSVAAILLYTAPFFVTVASAILYKEKITVKTVIALLSAFAGCVLIAGLDGGTTPRGLILGLLAGITYASYSIFGKKVMETYSPYTVTLYAFIFAALCAIATSNPAVFFPAVFSLGVKGIAITALTGLVTAFLPFALYTAGLSGTPAGKASVMATLEPLVATLMGLAVFHEVPGVFAFIGMALILLAILLLNNFGRRDGA